MLISFLKFYLLFIIAASLFLSLIVLKYKLRALPILLPLLIAIFVLPGIAGYIYIAYFAPLPEVVVPNLRGTPSFEAEVRLGALNLKSQFAGSLFDVEVPAGCVVSQRPEAGRVVKVGRIVTLFTSSGRRKVMVPNLLGRSLDQVGAVLSARGLVLGTLEKEVAVELDPGIILSQSPLPGEEIEAGAFVTVTVSASEEIETVEAGGTVETGEKKEGGFWFW